MDKMISSASSEDVFQTHLNNVLSIVDDARALLGLKGTNKMTLQSLDDVRAFLGLKGTDEMISGTDIRQSHLNAVRSVADAVRTSLAGTYDGATILNNTEVFKPAAKMLADLSRSLKAAAGDGTTTVVVLADALFKSARILLRGGLHPTAISNALHKLVIKAVIILESLALPLELSDPEALIKSSPTSLNSKVVSKYISLIVPLAVDFVPPHQDLADLQEFRTVKKPSWMVDDAELVKRSPVNKKFLIAGGLAPEIVISRHEEDADLLHEGLLTGS